jgi:hypothetical protein
MTNGNDYGLDEEDYYLVRTGNLRPLLEPKNKEMVINQTYLRRGI